MGSYEAGIIDGALGHVVWSQHESQEQAQRVARSYAQWVSIHRKGAAWFPGCVSGFWRSSGGAWVQEKLGAK